MTIHKLNESNMRNTRATFETMCSQIKATGYALGDAGLVRVHSLEKLDPMRLTTIMEDQSPSSKKRANGSVPGYRLLRKEANVLGGIICIDPGPLNRWQMIIYGRENGEKITELAQVLAKLNRVVIAVTPPLVRRQEHYSHNGFLRSVHLYFINPPK